MPYILRIIYKCMHNSEFIFPWLNRHITIYNSLYYNYITLSASYGHMTFVASRSYQTLVGLGYIHVQSYISNDYAYLIIHIEFG